jgi:hypothetical protein|tara:strand:- start:5713 stop:5898 length:186 start_codon:yes stop_codon:yes gene_type:complete
MARLNIGRLPLATDTFDRAQQDILIRELESIINQLNFTFQEDLKEELTSRSWFISSGSGSI